MIHAAALAAESRYLNNDFQLKIRSEYWNTKNSVNRLSCQIQIFREYTF